MAGGGLQVSAVENPPSRRRPPPNREMYKEGRFCTLYPHLVPPLRLPSSALSLARLSIPLHGTLSSLWPPMFFLSPAARCNVLSDYGAWFISLAQVCLTANLFLPATLTGRRRTAARKRNTDSLNATGVRRWLATRSNTRGMWSAIFAYQSSHHCRHLVCYSTGSTSTCSKAPSFRNNSILSP